MGFFDRFRSKKGAAGTTKTKHLKGAKEKPDQHDAFRAVSAGQSSTKEAAQQTKKVLKEDTRLAYRVLLEPVVTEKASAVGAAAAPQYLFRVGREANKIDVRKAFQAVYGVMPRHVRIIRIPGKRVRYGRWQGRTVARKKAIVTLAPGQKVDLGQG